MDNEIKIYNSEWELIRDGVADIACWHLGFKAANPNYDPPPQLQQLADLISLIKRRVIKS